jgi:TolB protein
LFVPVKHGVIVVVKPDGSLVRRFSAGPDFSASSDLRTIAFTTDTGIVVESLRHRGFRHVIRGNVYAPALTADGARLAYVDSNDRIAVSDAGGANVRDLTSDPTRLDEYPTWSPDGRRIAYYTNPQNPVVELWVMNADGSGKRELVSNGGIRDPNSTYDWPIAWSPDGTRIAYTGEDHGHYEIYVIDLQSGTRQQLAPTFRDAAAPSWSPDGKAIAFMSDHDNLKLKSGSIEIYVASVDGRRLLRLTHNRTDDVSPAWQPATSPRN